MNKQEARGLLARFLLDLQKQSYEQLAELIRNPVCVAVEAGSGVTYQIEYEAFWDSEPGRMIRVIATIDDGRFLTVLTPVTMDFLIDRDGEILA